VVDDAQTYVIKVLEQKPVLLFPNSEWFNG